ncbi:MAG: hypothetical protein AAF589_03935 [Planctomycetota bacterium]
MSRLPGGYRYAEYGRSQVNLLSAAVTLDRGIDIGVDELLPPDASVCFSYQRLVASPSRNAYRVVSLDTSRRVANDYDLGMLSMIERLPGLLMIAPADTNGDGVADSSDYRPSFNELGSHAWKFAE